MRPAYKLLALDLDGTLLTSGKTISETTRQWIRKAVEAGVVVMFATGRGLPNVEVFWNELGLQSPMVLLNGAELWKGPGEVWKRHFIPRDVIRRLHATATAAEAWYWGYCTEKFLNKIRWSEEAFNADWMKFGMRHDNPETVERIKEELLGWGMLEVAASGSRSLEISMKGITKESGIRDVCGLLGISMEDVMAVGDSGNDLALLRAAGMSVAMGNAEEEAREAAKAFTDHNDNDGVAKAIQHYLFKQTG